VDDGALAARAAHLAELIADSRALVDQGRESLRELEIARRYYNKYIAGRRKHLDQMRAELRAYTAHDYCGQR
jgi:hypothetical protein